jgi:hypothetical protein
MAKTWVLHTDTKGTGAQMVPLESLTKRSSPVEPVFVPRTPPAKPEALEPQPRPPHRFKVVDLMTREPLVEDATTRQTVEALRGIRSLVDVNMYVWQEEHQRWWLLTLGQKRTLWDLSRERDGV